MRVTAGMTKGFDTDGHTLFSNPKGFPIFVPDAVSFLDAQLNR